MTDFLGLLGYSLYVLLSTFVICAAVGGGAALGCCLPEWGRWFLDLFRRKHGPQ